MPQCRRSALRNSCFLWHWTGGASVSPTALLPGQWHRGHVNAAMSATAGPSGGQWSHRDSLWHSTILEAAWESYIRLYLPFSLPQLLVNMDGKALPKPPSISARPLTLQELVDHLTALTTNSLPLALAHISLHSGSDQGLGLLSGSRLSDIITALTVFGNRYDEERWLTFLRQAIPGCTELEAQWLVSHPSLTDSPLPAPQSQNKRKAPHSGGSEPHHMKRSAAGTNTPVRRSPRYHHTPMTEPTMVQDMEVPSPLAASHQSHRPQLSQAFRRLYGTAQHKGILAGLVLCIE
jgi:hypothetical protein